MGGAKQPTCPDKDPSEWWQGMRERGRERHGKRERGREKYGKRERER